MMKFLLTSKKCWLIDEKLLPFYQHLVDDYSDKLRKEWIKVEETDVETTTQVKEESLDDDLMEPQSLHLNNSTNHFKDLVTGEDQNFTHRQNTISSSSVQKKHQCTVCDKEFPTPSKLIIHMRVHSGEKPHTCSQCGKEFTQKSNLEQRVYTKRG